jgi:inner membrane protein involved in colicin E2 resistance
MAEHLNSTLGKALDPFTGKRDAGTGVNLQSKAAIDDFPGDFSKLKLSVIRPTLENIGNVLKERGHEINISEDAGGKISIHIVPAGAKKSIHPYDWFPTLSFIGAPFTRTVGLHGRNARRNSDSISGPRGDYKPSQVNKEMVEKELMKFVGEIANW